MQERNVFAGPYLDRDGHRRADPAWLESALADPRSRVLPVWDSLNLVADAAEGATASSSGARHGGGVDDPTLRAAFFGIDEIAPQRRPDLIPQGSQACYHCWARCRRHPRRIPRLRRLLVSALQRGDSLRLGRCSDCGGLMVTERLSLRATRCHHCVTRPVRPGVG
jgi:hypothetical protein